MFFTYRVMSAENTAQQEQQHSCVHSAASRIQTIFLKTQLIKIHYFFSKSIHPVCKDSVGQHLSLSLCSQASQASEMISVRHLFSTECSPHTSNLAFKRMLPPYPFFQKQVYCCWPAPLKSLTGIHCSTNTSCLLYITAEHSQWQFLREDLGGE